jgi:hypothetical protein
VTSSLLAKIQDEVTSSWERQDFDHLAYASIDFNTERIESFECINGIISDTSEVCFDLASLTKPLTLAAYFHLNPKKLTSDRELLLNHRAGLPAWGRLSQEDWKTQILNYNIKEQSNNLYSDFSALRLMLEVEKEEEKGFQELCSTYWDSDLLSWKDLSLSLNCPMTGWRNGHVISHEVNDDNCFRIDDFCSHAGLFSTIKGLSLTLLNLNKQTKFVSFMDQDSDSRFLHGWDTATGENTLAGIGPGNRVFGHLGFTGTSLWIDPNLKKGWILLTNATKDYWFHRKELNTLRRKLGALSWSM